MKGKPKAKPSGIRLVVVISDVHAGSTVGLLRPGFTTLEGQEVKHNAVQGWLWSCFEDCCRRLSEFVGDDPFALVVNGDICEGTHHHTKQIISPDVTDHVRAAEEILEPLSKRATTTIVVTGTEAHVGTTEQSLAKMLKATPDPDTGKAAWDRLSLTVAGTRCVFQHHISATTREYLKGSALSIFLGNEQLAAAKNGEPIPQVLVCSHRHDYDIFRDATGLCVVTPAWQALTRFGFKIVPAARIKPGLIVLDWRDRPDGSLPDVEPILCRAPAAKGAQI